MGRFVTKWTMRVAAAVVVLALLEGCNGGGGSNEGNPSAGGVVLSGAVFNNHTDEDAAGRAVAGATVVLVKAGDVEGTDSISPVEDLANANDFYPATVTGSDGHYQFAQRDFTDAYPANGTYFVFVEPPPELSGDLLPGGTASRASLNLDGATALKQDITLSDTNGSDSAYIGSMFCLFCHSQKNHIKHTLHFVGIRKIGPNGTVVNDAMNMGDTSVYDLSANNDAMLNKFTNPATRYTFANDPATPFWLGKDTSGFYFQLTADTNPKFYLAYSYGGETGKWKGHFMTTVTAGDGRYAPVHGQNGDDYAYYVMSPIQYNEDRNSIYGGEFVTYHAERWDFAGTGNNGFTGDAERTSFDLSCAPCHGATGITTVNAGLATERRAAVFPQNDNGYDFDGVHSEINIGCEKCHGPGYNHFAAGGYGRRIISPEKLSAGRLTMICGTCHIHGENQTDIGGGAPLMAVEGGNYETFRPGMSPGRFFGTWDGTGKTIAPFGIKEMGSLAGNGYLESINFETDTTASWIDMPWGAEVNHSKANQQHYQDVVRSAMYRNDRALLTCASCHDGHGSSHEHMLRYNADTNAACLPCHYGPGRTFPNVDDGMVGRLKQDAATPADKEVIGEDVAAHLFDKTGTLQMGPYDPEGTAMGKCIRCHMPKTAVSADYRNALVTRSGSSYRHGDISSHTFDVMATEAINNMGAARGITNTTPAGITDVCGSCHVFAGLQ